MIHHKQNGASKLSDLADVRRSLNDFEQLSQSERNRRRLVELLAFIRQLEATEVGKCDIDRRRRRFGECRQQTDESDRDYYGRLRTWLDREEQVAASE